MSRKKAGGQSFVEKTFIEYSGQELTFAPTEKVGVIVVDNFPDLGKLTALRFIEWVQHNPEGVVSLPTGKTPEYFIRHLTDYLAGWKKAGIRKELEEFGIDPGIRPDMKNLHFVQIDEFYPIDPTHHNSFFHYVNRFYLKGFSFDPKKALLINCADIGLPENMSLEEVWPDGSVDLALRFRQAAGKQESMQKRVIEAVDQWCYDYEVKIRSLGGIGFFLGGIGPDGHIAFNVMDSDHHSTTRLTPVNYETQAAAAGDLGGIEVAKKRLAITIGLSSICYNPQCVAVIMAAGEAKAQMVSDAIQNPAHIRYPASVLHSLPNARFYLTRGAASMLEERRFEALQQQDSLDEATVERIVIDMASDKCKQITSLTQKDFTDDRFGNLVLKKTGTGAAHVTRTVDESIRAKIKQGRESLCETRFLHTAPHHDDIMLGYLPYAVRSIRDASNRHTFAYLTSGFNAVTNVYALSLLEKLLWFLQRKTFDRLIAEDYFRPEGVTERNRDVWQYLDGVAANSNSVKDEGEARRLLRNMIEVFEEDDIDNLMHRIDELISYFKTQYPGKKDLPYIQALKGRIREWEADCLWGYLGFDSQSVAHLRLGFYKGEIFTEDPTIGRDVHPILKLMRNVKPDIVTVALDPEASGPDTHYKVLQAVAEALRLYSEETGRDDIQVLGYRNVWYRFHPSDANIFVPVSLNMFAVMQNSFVNAFVSQKTASFPSYEHDGPFSELAQRIQVSQYQTIKTCLGRRFFYEHPSPLIRATRGFVFLRMMTVKEFYTHARELRKSAGEKDG